MKKVLITLASVAGVLSAAAASVVFFGLYDVSATDQHLWPTYRFMEIAMRNSVSRRADGITPPPLDDEALIRRGLSHYREHCVQCHGAPGIAPAPFALALTPLPANLAHAGRVWTPAEIYWTVKHGIKMTGMPAWKYRMGEEDLWAIVAFVHRLPYLSPTEYQAMAKATPHHDHRPPPPSGRPDPRRGKILMREYACVTCHRIPGVIGPNAPVGPPLEGIGSRAMIAGLLPNEPGQMERWLRWPQQINPDGAMPDLGVTARDAEDMAAFLQTLK